MALVRMCDGGDCEHRARFIVKADGVESVDSCVECLSPIAERIADNNVERISLDVIE